MSVQINLQLPETVFSVLRKTPDEFVAEMRIAAAIKWYEIQQVSQAKAAEIAGLSRHDFFACLEPLRRFTIPGDTGSLIERSWL